jgi:predicted amidohydrolase
MTSRFISRISRVSIFMIAVWVMLPPELPALERDVTISVYQGPCFDGDFTQNLAAARQVVKQALDRGSDFVVLPETFLSGYDTPEHMRQGARRMEDPALQAFIAESGNHSMVILVGLARRTDKGIYNSELVIHRGKILGIYDKIMLTEGDRDKLQFLPGTDMPVFTVQGVRFAVIICHDSSFPFPALIARLKGAEILFSPHYNSISPQTVDAHRKWVRNCHVGLACQMKMVVARSNVVVTGNPKQVGYGDSFIISPQGEMLAEAALFRTELLTAKITPRLFKSPVVWADLDETPAALKAMLGRLLLPGSTP